MNILTTENFNKLLETLYKQSYAQYLLSNIWVIDQVWGQDGWMLPKFHFCVFMDRDEFELHKLAKRERGQCPAILNKFGQ